MINKNHNSGLGGIKTTATAVAVTMQLKKQVTHNINNKNYSSGSSNKSGEPI